MTYATDEAYVTDDAYGDGWRLMLGDSCERLAEIPGDSIDLSVCSPPFASLYTYSPSPRDLGNCSTRGEFLEHYGFIIREQLRVTRPGRNACVHVQQVTTRKSVEGYMGLTDFRGEVIRAFGNFVVRGNYVVTPSNLKGAEPIYFVGAPPEITVFELTRRA